jgi:hypothetical protein
MGDLCSKEETIPPASAAIEETNDEQAGGSFEQEILDYTNQVRESAGLEPLVLNEKLSQLAKDWNEHLKTQNACNIRHPVQTEQERSRYLPGTLGQNIYMSYGYPTDPSGAKDAVQSWYDECLDYVPPEPGQGIPANFDQVGHFTQLMWKPTKEMGCHEISCPRQINTDSGAVTAQGKIITCNYDQGNVSGEFPSNVIFTECPFNQFMDDVTPSV